MEQYGRAVHAQVILVNRAASSEIQENYKAFRGTEYMISHSQWLAGAWRTQPQRKNALISTVRST